MKNKARTIAFILTVVVLLSLMVVEWVGYLKLPFSLENKAKLLYNENFDGTNLSDTDWYACPEWDRQGGSKWDDDMSYLDGDGHLVLRAEWTHPSAR